MSPETPRSSPAPLPVHTVEVHVRIATRDRERLERYADAAGRSLASSIRYLIRRGLSEFEAESHDAV